MRDALRYPLVVYSPCIGRVSETFIRKFARDLLPGKTAVIAKNLFHDDPYWRHDYPTLILSRLPSLGRRGQIRATIRRLVYRRTPDKTAEAISAFLRRCQAKVVLANYMDEGLPLLRVAKALGLRFYVHGHGYDVSQRLRDERWRRAYLEYNKADGVIVVSDVARSRLIGIGLDPSLIHVIPCAPEFPADMRVEVESGSVRCLALGSMVPKKAPIMVLDAFRRAAEECPTLSLDYVGSGFLYSAAVSFVQAMSLQDRVVFHGAQPREGGVIRQLLQTADIYLQHSMTESETGDEEGLPVTILEMMAQGIPVISTRHAGIPEAVVDGVTGLLVDEGDSSAMAECILRLTFDVELRKQMGRAGRERARERFTWEKEKRELSQLLGLEQS